MPAAVQDASPQYRPGRAQQMRCLGQILLAGSQGFGDDDHPVNHRRQQLGVVRVGDRGSVDEAAVIILPKPLQTAAYGLTSFVQTDRLPFACCFDNEPLAWKDRNITRYGRYAERANLLRLRGLKSSSIGNQNPAPRLFGNLLPQRHCYVTDPFPARRGGQSDNLGAGLFRQNDGPHQELVCALQLISIPGARAAGSPIGPQSTQQREPNFDSNPHFILWSSAAAIQAG